MELVEDELGEKRERIQWRKRDNILTPVTKNLSRLDIVSHIDPTSVVLENQ